jgi:hypothetical protein
MVGGVGDSVGLLKSAVAPIQLPIRRRFTKTLIRCTTASAPEDLETRIAEKRPYPPTPCKAGNRMSLFLPVRLEQSPHDDG